MYKFMFRSARGKLVYFILMTLVAINSSIEYNQKQLTPTYRTGANFQSPVLVPIENVLRLNNDTVPQMRYRTQSNVAPRRYEGRKIHHFAIPSQLPDSWSSENASVNSKVPLRFRYMKKLIGRPIYQFLSTDADSVADVKTSPHIRIAREQMPVNEPTPVIDSFVMVTQSEVLHPVRKDDDPNSNNRINQVLESRMDVMEFHRNFKDQRGQNFSRLNKDEDGMNNNLRQNSYMSQANILLPGNKITKDDRDSAKPNIVQNTFMSRADISLPSPPANRTRFFVNKENEDMNLKHAIVRPNSHGPQVNPPSKSPYYEEVRITDASNRAYDRRPPGDMYMNFNDSEKGLNALVHENMMKLREFINSEIERKENVSSSQAFPDQR